jgi:dipeptidyl aminopeptidase/acylaminoacyl peptidase
VHDVQLSPNGDAFLDIHSALTRPPSVELRTTAGEPLGELARADISGLETIGYTPPEEFTVLAADGETTLWGALFRPHDFDPAKRYPVVEYIYGGPQNAMASHDFVWRGPFHSGVTAQAIAQLGYITLVLDGRGTPGRSKAFHDATYLRWANVVPDDHAEAIRQLAERHAFIDGDRVGIIGHSWGGYYSFRCLADRPDVYKAAVVSAAGHDANPFVLYEPYLDLPQRNPEGYAFADSYRLAARVEGELMLAVGSSDAPNWTDTIKMSEALIRAGKLHEFVALPEQGHAYDGVHDAYYWRKVARFFARHLRGDTTP